ncbi:putative lipoprotein [uncultured Gammaproteobacteria bacterium]|nr:putative lipoprotein [uncultured Gammaproteobacteria bacterium]
MKNMKNALNKLTKFLAVAILSVSLNAFSVVLDPPSLKHVSTIARTVITPNTGVGTTNLAFGKHATQSSRYPYSILTVAGYAVDGNTDGKFLNGSTTHTKYEQGAWWQVDLGSKKNIKQIIIYNRTDCCVNRLSNYQVSISDEADFSTHTYQQDFHVAPNPKKIIQLDASGKQGRYVRIQLLDKDYLSLAEVQVMGVDPLRFAEVDYSSSEQNDFDGAHNAYDAINYANRRAFAALKADGSIMAWGDDWGGTGAPSDKGYTKIYSNVSSFAALKADGSIKVWGARNSGGPNTPPEQGGVPTPSDSGYVKIYSNVSAFAALKADGSITTWGALGGRGAPSDGGYINIYSTNNAFAALKADGSIRVWGQSFYGGAHAPTDKGYTKIYSNSFAFAALKADGSIAAWGGGTTRTGPPFSSIHGIGFTKIYSNARAFAVLKSDGSIVAWGDSRYGGGYLSRVAPSDSGYTKIYSNARAFAALKADGSIATWGEPESGGTNAPNVPTDNGYIKIYSNERAFAALKADGSITTWGNSGSGGINAPTDKGYTKIYSSERAFAALKADGSIMSWGDLKSGATNAPTDKGYTRIYSNAYAFTAVKPDGSIRTWGDSGYGGAYASDYNLALGKPATESSTYTGSIPVAAGYAVDGNTDGEFLNSSITHTNYEQGAWWQVDLGSKKNINKIIIYNRTDCCADRLRNYQVSISDKADFSTHAYQQNFHVAPDPKKIIQLGVSGKQGRYVRIQLLDKNYLSLAEVQVMGVDL